MVTRSDGIKHPKKAAMLSALAKTGIVAASARAADISRSTHYEWVKTDPEYAAAVNDALEESVEVLEAIARRRASVGSDVLLMFLLKAARPEKYRERYHLEHQVKPFTLIDAIREIEERRRANPESRPPHQPPPPKEN